MAAEDYSSVRQSVAIVWRGAAARQEATPQNSRFVRGFKALPLNPWALVTDLSVTRDELIRVTTASHCRSSTAGAYADRDPAEATTH
jgi:hypothetical protein